MRLVRAMGLVMAAGLMTAGTAVAQARPAARPAAAPSKVGYVNFRVALSQVPGYAQAESTFVKEQQDAQKLLKAIEDSAEAARTEFEARAATLPPAQADAQRKALEAKGAGWAARADTLQARLQTRERELLAPMQQRAGAALEAVRRENGYAIVFDASAPSNTIIVADTTADLTGKVITKLKAGGRN